jgi:multimeric flavodoxin WrbA
MKVLLLNGSPKSEGSTYTALLEVANSLEEERIETEIFQIGNKPISGCIACLGCRKTGRCVIDDDVNKFLDKAIEVDGFVFGSPVHYAALSGALTSFLDRAFYAATPEFRGKLGAGIVVCRRGGSTAAFDQLNKYFTISQMPIVSSHYWNMVHGNSPEQVKQDLEGIQTMYVLGKNMSWLLKSIDAGKKAGIGLPEQKQREWTNFIR